MGEGRTIVMVTHDMRVAQPSESFGLSEEGSARTETGGRHEREGGN